MASVRSAQDPPLGAVTRLFDLDPTFEADDFASDLCLLFPEP